MERRANNKCIHAQYASALTYCFTHFTFFAFVTTIENLLIFRPVGIFERAKPNVRQPWNKRTIQVGASSSSHDVHRKRTALLLVVVVVGPTRRHQLHQQYQSTCSAPLDNDATTTATASHESRCRSTALIFASLLGQAAENE